MSQCGSLKQNSAFNNLPPAIEVLTVFFPAFNDSIGIKVSLHKGFWKTGFITSNISFSFHITIFKVGWEYNSN